MKDSRRKGQGFITGFDSSTHTPNENEFGVEKPEEINTAHDMKII